MKLLMIEFSFNFIDDKFNSIETSRINPFMINKKQNKNNNNNNKKHLFLLIKEYFLLNRLNCEESMKK